MLSDKEADAMRMLSYQCPSCPMCHSPLEMRDATVQDYWLCTNRGCRFYEWIPVLRSMIPLPSPSTFRRN